MDVVAFLNQPWVGTAAKLVGILVTIVLLVGRRPKRRLAVQGRSVPLVSRSSEIPASELVVTYQGRQVPCLWRTTIIVWNAGNRTLRGSDLVNADPLRIEHDGAVLRSAVTNVSRAATGFRVSMSSDQTTVEFHFDFLDPKDGAVVEILHTDPSADGFLCGTLIGVPGTWTNRGRIPITSFDQAERGGNRIPLVFPLLAAPLGVFYMLAGLLPDLVIRILTSLGIGSVIHVVGGRLDWFYVVAGFFLTFFAGRILARVRAGPPTALLNAASGAARVVESIEGNPKPRVDEGAAESGESRPAGRTDDA